MVSIAALTAGLPIGVGVPAEDGGRAAAVRIFRAADSAAWPRLNGSDSTAREALDPLHAFGAP